MQSNAPGQLLGYAIQFPRALYHLLKSGPGDAVCVENLGDVATTAPNGEVITEEDKSSTSGNPLTDRSTNLWKTFSNWIDVIKSDDLDVEKTKFVLYCNQSGKPGIVDKFSSAQNQPDAQNAIDYAKAELKDIKQGHGIWEYYDYVVNQNESLLLKVVQRFELQRGVGAGYDEVRREIRRLLIPESQVEFFIDKISGWLLKKISEKLAEKTPAIIRWEEYERQFKVLFGRAHRLELIDFTLQNPPHECNIQHQVKIRPCYLRQLEIIDASDEIILEAVSDFLRAEVNRNKWIEDEIIDEDVASDFNSKLKKYWENTRNKIEITHKNFTEKERGQVLYFDCQTRQEAIRGSFPPAPTIAGTYHALANEPILGWHSNWEKLFPRRKEE